MPSFLRSLRLTNRLVTSLVARRSFLILQPTVSACHKVVGFLFCTENLEIPFCMRQADLCFFLTHQQFQHLHLHFHIVAFLQVIFHCRNYTSFPSTPDTLLCFQIRLPLAFIHRSKRNLLWRKFMEFGDFLHGLQVRDRKRCLSILHVRDWGSGRFVLHQGGGLQRQGGLPKPVPYRTWVVRILLQDPGPLGFVGFRRFSSPFATVGSRSRRWAS